jgi:phosphate transport system substrate-binding protein
MTKSRMMRFASVALVAVVVASLLIPNVAFAAITLKITGSTTLQPLTQMWASAYKRAYPGSRITVAGGGSGTGKSNASGGSADIGMSSTDYGAAGTLGSLVETKVARDAVALVVNKKNPVKNLTAAQIKAIYLRQITNWKSVGGPNKSIVLIGRTGASGTYDFFKSKLLGGSRQSSRTKMYASNGMVRSAVTRNRYAIGYISIAYVNRNVKALRVDGVAPSRGNALSGAYPYVRYLFFLTKGAPDSSEQSFINYCLSSAGQRLAAAENLPLH